MSLVKVCLSAGILLAAATLHAQPCPGPPGCTNWIGNVFSSQWSDPQNWDNGVPSNPGSIAVINQSGALVNLDVPFVNIDALQLSNGFLAFGGSTLQLVPPNTAAAPLTMGPNTTLNFADFSGPASLNFQLNGSGQTYSSTADATAQINVTGFGANIGIYSNGGTSNTLNLTGGAALSLFNGATITGDNTTTLNTDFTIHGDGSISSLSMNYSGSLDTMNGGLSIAPGSGNAFTNTGTLTATFAPLTLDASSGGTFLNNNVIEAGSYFLANLILNGIASNNTGVASLTNNAAINVDSGGLFQVKSPDGSPVFINNTGTINLNANNLDAVNTTLELKGDTFNPVTFTLNGAGAVKMSDSAFNQIDGFNGTETLVNGAGHTIQGSGTAWALNLVNNGAMIADGVNNALVISGNSAAFNPSDIGFTNNGTITVSGAAAPAMIVDTTFGQFQNSSTGTLTVTSGSTLQFGSQALGGALINDGAIANNGTIQFDSYSGTFSLSSPGGTGRLMLNPNSAITAGTGSELLVNGLGHTIESDGGSVAIGLINNGTVQVDGGGMFVGSDLTNNELIQINGGLGLQMENAVLTNNGLIIGDSIGFDPGSRATLVNNGQIDVNSLAFGVSGSKTITNNGTINLGGDLSFSAPGPGANVALTGSGTLNLGSNNITGPGVNLTIGAGQTVTGGGGFISPTLTNEGSIVATGAAGPLTIFNLTNYDAASGALSGGSYTADGQNLAILNLGPVRAIGANTSVTLSGAGILTPDGFTDAMTALAVNDGTLHLAGGHSLTLDNSAATFANNGTLTIDAGSMLDASSRAFQSLSGAGNLSGNYNVGGTFLFTPQAGSDGFIQVITSGSSVALSGSGLITFDGGTNALSGLLVNQGTLSLDNSSLILNGSSFSNPGTLTLNNNATLDARAGSFQQYSGGHLTAGTYNIGTGSTFFFSNNTANITNIDSGVSVALTGDGRIAYGTGAGTDALTHLSQNDGTFSVNGNRNFVLDNSVATFTNNGTLQVGDGATFNTNNAAFQNVTNGNLTGNYVIGGTFQYSPKAGESGITSIDAAASLTLSGAGTVVYGAGAAPALATLDTNNGALSLVNGAALLVNGGFTNSGTMSVSGGSFFAAGGAVSNNASLTVAGNSVLVAPGYQGITGSTLTVGTGSAADFTGGLFGNIDATGSLNSGNFVIAGTLSIQDPAVAINLINTDASLTLSGKYRFVTGTGNNALADLSENLGSLTLLNGAALDVSGNISGGGFFGNDFPGGPNTAQLTISGMGSNLTSLGLGNAGIVTINQGGTLLSRELVVNFGAIAVDGSNSKISGSGLGMIGPGATLTLTNGATADFRSGFIANFGAQTDTFLNLQSGGVLSGGTYNIGGNFLFDPNSDSVGGNIVLIDTNTSLTMSGKGKLLYGSGDGTDALTQLFENDGQFAVVQGASVNTSSDFFNTGDMLVATGGLFGAAGAFFNEAAVTIDPTSAIAAGGAYIQGGGQTQVDGQLNGVVALHGGRLNGNGTINGSVEQDGGTLKPGDSPGILTIAGDYLQLPGTLLIEFAGRNTPGIDWGQLYVGGTADLAGYIDVSLLNSINFQLGDLFPILYAGNLINDGVQITGNGPGLGMQWDFVFKNGELDLQVGSATPEPETWALIGGALLLIAGVRWGKRQGVSEASPGVLS